MARPVEHQPDRWAGETQGMSGPSAPVYLVWARIEYDDGSEREHAAWTRQWTHRHVYVVLEETPTYHLHPRERPADVQRLWVRAEQVRIRETPPVQ